MLTIGHIAKDVGRNQAILRKTAILTTNIECSDGTREAEAVINKLNDTAREATIGKQSALRSYATLNIKLREVYIKSGAQYTESYLDFKKRMRRLKRGK